MGTTQAEGQEESALLGILARLRPWHYSVLSVAISLLFVVGMSLLFHGRVTHDYLITGAVTAGLVSQLVLRLVYFYRDRLQRMAEERQEELATRQQLETSLDHSQQDFRDIMKRSPDGVALISDGVYAYVNEAWARAHGYDEPAELIGQRMADLVHPDDREVIGQRIRSFAETGVPPSPREFSFLRPDGSTAVLFSAPIKVVRFRGKEANLVVARDVSELKRMQTRLAISERMSSLGIMAAGIGHEINNPLAYITANIDYVLEELEQLDLPAERREELMSALSDAQAGAGRVTHIVRDLKGVSRPEEEHQRHLDLELVIQHSLSMTGNEIRHRARLVEELEPVPPVLANEARMTQVMVNLLLNAAQSISEGATEDNVITVRLNTEGDRVVVRISDTGAGISKADQPRIFDPFYTTKDVGQGTGWGCRSATASSPPATAPSRWRAARERAARSPSRCRPRRWKRSRSAPRRINPRGSRGCACWWWTTIARCPTPSAGRCRPMR